MFPLTAADTLATLIERARQEAVEARAARIAKAKTNVDALIEAGVLITEDDAFDRAMQDLGDREYATAHGLSLILAWEIRRNASSVLSTAERLRFIVAAKETPAEERARRESILAAAVGTLNGRRCAHRGTKKERGWINAIGCHNFAASDDAGNRPFVCCRCGARATVPPVTEPTEQAKIAAAILERSTDEINAAKAVFGMR